MAVARVALDIPARALADAFDYDIPPNLESEARVGCAVLVEFGHRKAVGHVVDVVASSDVPGRKPLCAVLSPPRFDEVSARLAAWIAGEYVAPLADAVRLFLPSGSVPEVAKTDDGWQLVRPRVRQATERVVEICGDAGFVPAVSATRQRAVLDALAAGPLTTGELNALLGPVSSVVTRLSEAGAVRVRERQRSRGPAPVSRPAPRHEELSVGQSGALDTIDAAQPGSWVVVKGVTGSGKTEVYLRAIEKVRAAGRGAIVLVPEISLTPQTVGRFRSRFGDEIAVLHSRLSAGERFDEFERVARGEARVVVGARSALFAPVTDLGIVVIDEEHETSYKQGSSPRYHAREVARRLVELRSAVLVTGSATPSMESLHAAETGRCALCELPERVGGGALPEIEVVDLGAEFATGNRSMFSRRLVEELIGVQERGEKAILLMNRRGYASFLLCRECGHVPGCDRCSTSLTFHETGPVLMCHHCAARVAVPPVCPKCESPYLRRFGAGTQRVAEEVALVVPELPVVRMDADTTSNKGGHERRLAEFESHSSAVLVGTQMLAKGLDYPSVTLVGVVTADTTLHLPDVRAGERTFQMLEQVAGRAGRGPQGGRVIIQTYWPEHAAIRAVVTRDPEVFYAQDRGERRDLGYPPFGRIANITLTARVRSRAKEHADVIARTIAEHAPEQVRVLGPSPAPLARIKDRYRWHVLVKAPEGHPLSELVRAALAAVPSASDVSVAPDIDPLDLM